MGEKLQRFFLLVGLVLYLFDFGSDIYVAVQYMNNLEIGWFLSTFLFISIPSAAVNITALVRNENIWTYIYSFLQVHIVVCYLKEILSQEPNTYFIAKLRYLETILESAPQWCLQVYIMLRQWSFPWYTLVSSVFSMLSLAWSIITLEKERRMKNYNDFDCIKGFMFLMWQLSTLVSRLFAIVLYAYVFRYYVIIPLAVHWLLLAVTIFVIEVFVKSGESLWLLLVATIPSVLHSAESVLPVKHAKRGMTVGYVFLILSTIIMVTLSLVTEMHVLHMDVLQPIAIASVAGVLPLSLCFGSYVIVETFASC